ncbi:NTP transferase domain-containing protein [Clostridium polynesiense]|uniref:NTP transferase domain-containing protein n=1 Tax=Clostridium polynesiense TaxID=1325933 RepID=UPI001FA81771|nr:NTP transferase domain-containing protein [Clostridium polynesiense]
MAAGAASRFAPISYEKPKALIEVRGEVLIERQIRQLREAGIEEIVIVTGYKAEQFEYLKEKFGVILVHNPEFLNRNNNGSIFAAREYLKNSYICSSDNYFLQDPFECEVEDSYYSCVYAEGSTEEWCVTEKDGWIQDVKVGGTDSWIMLGHVFWSNEFSQKFLSILEEEYEKPETVDKLWETNLHRAYAGTSFKDSKVSGRFYF